MDNIVVVAALAQAAYYTVLIVVVASRLSARMAVMEFKVEELWRHSAASAPGDGDGHGN